MNPPRHSSFHSCRVALPYVFGLIFVVACSAPVQRPTGPHRVLNDAQDMFKRGRFDRALDFTDGLAKASPPNAFTERARVLRVVIFSGQVKGYKELVDAYGKGIDATRNLRFKTDYGRLRHDYLQFGSRLALGLGEVAHLLTEGASISKELTLEAPYPTTEGPLDVAQLIRVKEGGWVEPDDQEAAALDAQRKGIDDALAEVVGGDRAKARSVLAAGPVKLDGVDFALFLGKQLLTGASLFDRKHIRDSLKFRTLANEAEEAAKAALSLLKESPNKDKEKQVKKLQDQIKAALKTM